MTKKSLLLCAALLFCAVNMPAKGNSLEWYAVTDNNTSIAISQIAYLLFTDNSKYFAIVQTDNQVVDSVSCMVFRQYSGISATPKEQPSVALYPNPVTSQLTLQGLSEKAPIHIVSLDGKTVVDTTADRGKTVIDVSSLPAGIYLLNTQNTTLKFIKK